MADFTPYHQMTSSTELERIVADYRKGGMVTDAVYTDYCRYHWALLHKLKSAKHNLDRLEAALTSTSIDGALEAEFHFSVNMSTDGFFYAGGSALDILAREVLTYFGLPLPNEVYFRHARQYLAAAHAADPLLPRLNDPPWLNDFKTYRNALTHEVIIANNYQINVANDGAVQTHTIVFPLPDDPRVEAGGRTFRNHPNLLQYAKQHMRRMLILANTIHGELATRVRMHGSLPL